MIRNFGLCLASFFLFGCSAEQSLETQDHPLITAYSQAYNEVTINWNAPLFWMAAFLDATEE